MREIAMDLKIFTFTVIFILSTLGRAYSQQELDESETEVNESLTAVDAMQMYMNSENIDVLVPESKIQGKKYQSKKLEQKGIGSMRRSEGAVATVDEGNSGSGEDDSLELIDLGEGDGDDSLEKDKKEIDELQDNQSCGFTPYRHSQESGSYFRVVGGQNVKAGSWPWMAGVGALVNGTKITFHCGGSLVSASHVITAAHCVDDDFYSQLAVRLGVTKLTNRTAALDVHVKRVVPHPGFKRTTAQHDIAVLFLSEPVAFTNRVHPICLPQDTEHSSFEYTFPFVIGWGRLAEDGDQSLWLQEVRIPVISNEDCRVAYAALPPANRISIRDGQMCCGYFDGGRDACQGDSGGPLMLTTESHARGETYLLIGIVSLGGEGCARPGVPGVYTRITSYLEWLNKTMEN